MIKSLYIPYSFKNNFTILFSYVSFKVNIQSTRHNQHKRDRKFKVYNYAPVHIKAKQFMFNVHS